MFVKPFRAVLLTPYLELNDLVQYLVSGFTTCLQDQFYIGELVTRQWFIEFS